MRIIDCFTYTGNLEVIELRLRLLPDVIDKFVIAETDHYYNAVYKGFSLKSKLKELCLYSDKIEIVELYKCIHLFETSPRKIYFI